MNDDLEIIEEFQSDSINELVNERKKNRAVQRFMMRPLAFTKYYYIEKFPNGDSLKSEIKPEELDDLGIKETVAKQKHRSDSLFYATIPTVDGWFNRINDIGNKFGCDTIFKSRHSKK